VVVQFNLLILYELFGLLFFEFMIINEKEAVNWVLSIHITVSNMGNKYTYIDIYLTKESDLCYYLSSCMALNVRGF